MTCRDRTLSCPCVFCSDYSVSELMDRTLFCPYDSMFNKFANIAFNLPVDSLFTYTIPAAIKDEIKIGSRY
jgi:hypothetical protein